MWKLRGYPRVVKRLEKLTPQDLPCAYLILGPPHTGKTTLALDLACLMNCGGRERPCGECSSCRRIISGQHPDVVVIKAPEGRGEVSIDQIREMERRASLPPFEGVAKTFIIQGRLSLEGANSLLKTLEEPPQKTLFILTSSGRESLPSTVISRCAQVELCPLPFSEVEEELMDKGVPEDRARFLTRLSGGRMGWAIAAVRDEEVIGRRKEVLSDVAAKLELRIGQRLQGLNVPPNLDETLNLWEGLWRDVLLFQASVPEFVSHLDMMPEIKHISSKLKLSEVVHFLLLLSQAKESFKKNANPRILLELLLINMPRLEEEVGKAHPA